MIPGVEELTYIEELMKKQCKITDNYDGTEFDGILLNNDRIKAEIRKSLKDIIKVAGRENVLHAKRDGYCTWVVHVPFKTNKFLGTDEIPVIDGFIVELRYCSSNKFHPECVTIKMMESTWYQRPEAA